MAHLISVIHPENAASMRVAERLGETFERTLAGRRSEPSHPERSNGMKYFKTFVSLPPHALSSSRVREFFHRVFGARPWFRPVQYGRAFTDGRLDPDHIDFDALVAFYEQYQNITVKSRTERDYLILYPARPGDPPYIGHLIWATSVKEASKPAWRAAHLPQVFEVMHLLRAPLAQAGLAEDLTRKTWRLVPHPDGLSLTETSTVRDYGEGLPGLGWRNFFGPPFVKMFGERLSSLPGAFKQELGGASCWCSPTNFPPRLAHPKPPLVSASSSRTLALSASMTTSATSNPPGFRT